MNLLGDGVDFIFTENILFKEIPLDFKYCPQLQSLSAVYIQSLDNGSNYVIPINHIEGSAVSKETIISELSGCKAIYTFDSKSLLHNFKIASIDLIMLRHLQNLPKISFLDELEKQLFKIYPFWRGLKTNELFLTVLGNFYNNFFKDLLEGLDLNLNLPLYTKIAPLVFYNIEKTPIKVNLNLFNSKYKLTNNSYSLYNDQLYNYYSLENLTARPSNSFNNLNLMALRKEKEFRECFIPNNDFFVEFDYDAYHLRLIAEQCNYKIKGNRAHEEFAKLYFNKDKITEKDYKQAKILSFKMFYKGIDRQYLNLKFFNAVDKLIRKLWDDYLLNGFVICPKSTRKIKNVPNATMNKVFSYWVQCLETSENILTLNILLNLLKNYKSKIVLYQYDSIIIDMANSEVGLIEKIKNIMSSKFPIKYNRYNTFPF